MKKPEYKLTLDRPATYQIKVPGELDKSWSDWAGSMYKTALTALAELARRTILTSTGKLSERDDGYGGNLGKEDR